MSDEKIPKNGTLGGEYPPICTRAQAGRAGGAGEGGLSSPEAFALRRCQIVLASVAGERVPAIARRVGRTARAVHAVLDAFEARVRGPWAGRLLAAAQRPHTIHAAFRASQAVALRTLLHQRPRTFDKPTSLWTLKLAAAVSFEQGLTPTRVSGETIRATLARLGVKWQRAKDWITSPDLEYARKKAPATV